MCGSPSDWIRRSVPTVDDLADALVAQPGTIVIADRPVTRRRLLRAIPRLHRRLLDRELRRYATLNRWTTVSSGTSREALDDEHDQVWILDVDGQRIIIDAFDFPTTSEADRAELDAVIDTVRISPN